VFSGQSSCQDHRRTWTTESIWLSISQAAFLGDFLFAPMCPIEKITPLFNETDDGVARDDAKLTDRKP